MRKNTLISKESNLFVCLYLLQTAMGMYNTGLSFISTESEVILLYVKKAMVTGISLNPSVTKDQIIPVRQLKTAVGVDVSVEDQYLFWSDITADSISRVFFNGSGRETVVSDGKLFTLVDITP